jgi:hypothetical protein
MPTTVQSAMIKKLKEHNQVISRMSSILVGARLIPFTNRSGGVLNSGDVVMIDTGNEASVVLSVGAQCTWPFVVVAGCSNLGIVSIAPRGYGITWVNCDANDVHYGDALISSTLSGLGAPANPASVNVYDMLGIAVGEKTSGVAGKVLAMI